MPDLSIQIGTLYRIIGEIDSGANAAARPDRSFSRQEAATFSVGSTQPLVQGFVKVRWICKFYSLWFSLPLSIWLSSGWIGLLLYWQVLSGVACLVEKLMRRSTPETKQLGAREQESSCSAIQHEARAISMLATSRPLRQLP